MTSTIKVDNIQDQCGTAVVTKCGSNKTLAVTTAKQITIKQLMVEI